MINKDLYMESAKGFSTPNSCFIHTEMKDGIHPETILAGDFQAIMWGIVAEINRVGDRVGAEWVDMLGMINALHDMGYEKASRGIDKSNLEVIPGEDWEESWRQQIRLEETKKANISLAKLKVELNKLMQNYDSLKYQVNEVKRTKDAEIAALRSEKQMLTKECNALEARLREMERRNLYGNCNSEC